MRSCSKNRVELLSPAGGMDCLKAAVANGCDAVYLGGKQYSARRMAENFDGGSLEEAIDYAHVRGVRVYIAVNTLYRNSELDALMAFCAETARMGADAFIMQDIGAAGFVRDAFGVELHASTQLTCKTAEDAVYLKNLGFQRIILSRETSLGEIKKIARIVESEVFVHGALCYSYSGQCLMSASIGGRSGNRGDCAQPCRLPYRLARADFSVGEQTLAEGPLLSLKDMMTLELLPEVVASGVRALKIEGRMKGPQYTALVTHAYRERLDALERGETGAGALTETIKELTQVFSRGGGFCTGYFHTHASAEMLSGVVKNTGALIGEVLKYTAGTGPSASRCVVRLTDTLVGGDGVTIGDTGAYYNAAKPATAGDVVTVAVHGDIHRGDKVYKSYDKRLDDRLKKLAAGGSDTRRLSLRAAVTAKADQPLRFTLSYDKCGCVTALEETGGTVERAVARPLTKERLLAQLSKSGSTPFTIEFAECEVDEDIYADIGAVNEVRRRALAEMERRLAEMYKREAVAYTSPLRAVAGKSSSDPASADDSRLTVAVMTLEQAQAVLTFCLSQDVSLHRLYLECAPENANALDRLSPQARAASIGLFIALPPCPWPDEDALFTRLEASGIVGYLARTYGHLQKLRTINSKKEIALDYSFNVTNTLSLTRLAGVATTVCLSPELDFLPEGGPLPEGGLLPKPGVSETCASEVVGYGRITLMTTNQCPIGHYAAKTRGGRYCSSHRDAANGGFVLIDRKAAVFPVMTDCEACVARIVSPLGTMRNPDGLGQSSADYTRVAFTTEAPDECIRILKAMTSDKVVRSC